VDLSESHMKFVGWVYPVWHTRCSCVLDRFPTWLKHRHVCIRGFCTYSVKIPVNSNILCTQVTGIKGRLLKSTINVWKWLYNNPPPSTSGSEATWFTTPLLIVAFGAEVFLSSQGHDGFDGMDRHGDKPRVSQGRNPGFMTGPVISLWNDQLY